MSEPRMLTIEATIIGGKMTLATSRKGDISPLELLGIIELMREAALNNNFRGLNKSGHTDPATPE